MISIVVLAFLAGLAIGSFVSVVAYRVPRGESIVGGRSKCPDCGAQIAARDNIPVLSWLLLRGRCRSCGERISPRYPLVELSLGVLFAISVVVLGDDGVELALGLILISVLATITLTDLDKRVIPNVVLIFAVAVLVPIVIAGDPSSIPERAIAGAAGFGLLLLAALAYPRGMGMGDVKLAGVMGLYLGRSIGPALLIAFAVGALVGVGMMLSEGMSARKRAIPFGPFLALGGVVGVLAGNELVNAYLDAFVHSS